MMLLVVVAVLVVAAVFLVSVYNGFIVLANQATSAWSDIDVQLKLRYDLIPNLVETVKGYAKHESQTFEKVVQARAAAMGAKTVHDREVAENNMQGALKSLFAIAESYPDLKAQANFSQLQGQLSEIENSLQSSRRFYNGAVRDLNTKIEMFPYNLIAGAFGIKKREFFEVSSPAEKEAVKVQF